MDKSVTAFMSFSLTGSCSAYYDIERNTTYSSALFFNPKYRVLMQRLPVHKAGFLLPFLSLLPGEHLEIARPAMDYLLASSLLNMKLTKSLETGT